MKIQLNAADFSKQLDFAIKAVAKNGIIPELECFLLQADAHRVTITATNLETQIRTECVALCEGDFAAFSVTVIARTFCDAIKALGAQNITLNFGGDKLEIVSKKGKYKMQTEIGADFPIFDEIEDSFGFTVNCLQLEKAIESVSFAVSKDEMRAAMCGVYVELDYTNDTVSFVATDAHRLAKFEMPTTYHHKDNGIEPFIIPAKGLKLAKSLIDKFKKLYEFNDNTDISLFYLGNAVQFGEEQDTVTVRLTDEKYPDCASVVPKDVTTTVTVNRSELRESLRCVGIFADTDTNRVILNFDYDHLLLTTRDEMNGKEATHQIACETGGEPLQIAFNATYLHEITGVFDGDEIHFSLTDARKAALIETVGGAADEAFFVVLMPVMINVD